MKKFLISGILVVFLFAMGFVFVQEADTTEKEGIPQIIQFQGVNWIVLKPVPVRSFDDLDAELTFLLVGDMDRLVGTADFLVLANKDGGNLHILAVWYNTYKLEDMRGWVIKDDGKPLETKTYTEGEYLQCMEDKDEEGNLVLKFFWHERGAEPELVRTINIRKFVEEKFKDSSSKK